MEASRLLTQMRLCDWTDFDIRHTAVLAAVERGEVAAAPFQMMLFSDTPALHLRAANTWMAAKKSRGSPAQASCSPALD